MQPMTQPVKHDGELVISEGRSRAETDWKRRQIKWSELLNRFAEPKRTAETLSEYAAMTPDKRGDVKDVGGFVGGALNGGARKADSVAFRSLLVLDADYASMDLWNDVTMLVGHAACVHSTHSHTKEKPRLRLMWPLLRPVTPCEYEAVARKVASWVGMEPFDDTTYQANRLMYYPSVSKDGEYVFDVQDGPWLDPDAVLAEYADWRDRSQWPVSSRERKLRQDRASKQGDPREKPGIVGAFCRVYDVPGAIEAFLPGIYTPCGEGRYTFTGGTTSGGLVLYDGGDFAYSHHSTDPACGRLCNAFDLVRLHLYGEMEDKASYDAMCALAGDDEHVRIQIADERLAAAKDDFAPSDWRKRLSYEKNSTVLKNSIKNLLLILNNDEAFQGIRFNQLSGQIYATGLPWERPQHPAWRDADTAQLVSYIDKVYGTFSARNYEICLLKVADDRAYHPIRDYLNALPEWDGVKRVDELLIKYFGAEDNTYTRSVIRKTLCAAVARIYQPGIKFDSMLVLNGPTDLGKSTFFARLAGDWFSDSLNFADMGKGKDAAEKLQGIWIVEIPELAGLSKMDVNNIKGFLSRQDDQYRPSYGRTVESHPRQCIIVGSTNAEGAGFLRDATGNRRFWVVRIPGCKRKGWDLPKEDTAQIWAEAKRYWEKGETLYLTGDAAEISKAEQLKALETDEREDIVRDYLELLLPDNWYDMDVFERRNYFLSDAERTKVGKPREFISNMEIWCECFGNDRGKFDRQSDSYRIKLIMQKIGGWVPLEGKRRVKKYGMLRVWGCCQEGVQEAP